MSNVIKATKKPVTISAVQWAGNNHLEVYDFTECCAGINDDGEMSITTLEGEMVASVGDYIIKGVNGEFYPCKPDIFLATYDIHGKPEAEFNTKQGGDSDE